MLSLKWNIIFILLVLAFSNPISGFTQSEQKQPLLVIKLPKTKWGNVKTLVFSPNSKILASVEQEYNIIKLWDVKTGKEIRGLEGHSKAVSSIAFSPDGQMIASGSHDGTVKLWAIKTGKLLKTLVKGKKLWINVVLFSPNGKLLVSGGEGYQYNGHIPLFNQLTYRWEQPRDKYYYPVRLWDVKTGRLLKKFGYGNVRHLSFSSDSKFLAGTSDVISPFIRSYYVGIWNIQAYQKIWWKRIISSSDIKKLNKRKLKISDFSLTKNTLKLQLLCGIFFLFDLTEDGKEIKYTFIRYRSTIKSPSCCFSHNSRYIASGSLKGKIEVRRIKSGKLVQSFKSSGSVGSLVFSPDDKILASGNNGKIYLWNGPKTN